MIVSAIALLSVLHLGEYQKELDPRYWAALSKFFTHHDAIVAAALPLERSPINRTQDGALWRVSIRWVSGEDPPERIILEMGQDDNCTVALTRVVGGALQDQIPEMLVDDLDATPEALAGRLEVVSATAQCAQCRGLGKVAREFVGLKQTVIPHRPSIVVSPQYSVLVESDLFEGTWWFRVANDKNDLIAWVQKVIDVVDGECNLGIREPRQANCANDSGEQEP